MEAGYVFNFPFPLAMVIIRVRFSQYSPVKDTTCMSLPSFPSLRIQPNKNTCSSTPVKKASLGMNSLSTAQPGVPS